MNRIYKIFFFVLLFGVLAYVALYFLKPKSQQNVSLINVKATLVCNTDDILVMRADKEDWEAAKNGDEISWGDRLSVPSNATARLVINTESRLDIEEDSEVWLERTEDGKGAVYVVKGEVRYYLDSDVSRNLGKLKYQGGEVVIIADNSRHARAESSLNRKGTHAALSNYKGDVSLKIQSGDCEIESGKAAIIPPDGSKPSIVSLPEAPSFRTPRTGEEIAQGYMRIGLEWCGLLYQVPTNTDYSFYLGKVTLKASLSPPILDLE